MKTAVLVSAVLLLLAACGGSPRRNAASGGGGDDPAVRVAVSDGHNAENSLDYPGVYAGTLPAADCPGIEVRLTLRADGSYAETDRYLERDAVFSEEGRYEVKGNLLFLAPSEGADAVRYKVEENRLRRLDGDGRTIEGPLAEHYVLIKIE